MCCAIFLSCVATGYLYTRIDNVVNGGTGIYDYVANAVSADYSIIGQVWIQAKAVLTTIVWSGVVSFVSFKLVDLVVGMRVPEDEEREGLDITSHCETAYES